ncbi:hypothetical protein LIER_16452 [Lithospermum erythrorhizon]|uniref:Reverse transcriptase domain-containing protein n=1 Tax=Lithospermum erythrorhizon TaxID=34254 RepID=A0AAV3Q7K1_LITER
MLVQELAHQIDRNVQGGNVIMKLDMTKAFDKVSWSFLSIILQKFGFSDAWISLVMSCVTNCWFSMVVNGHLQGYFRSEQGVRQGDPLSPSLFILAQAYLIRGQEHLYQQFPSLRYKTGCSLPISSLSFADDTILFCNGRKESIEKVISFLDHFQAVSGQLINQSKSSCIVSKKASQSRKHIIVRVARFRVIYLSPISACQLVKEGIN